ncbi:MAG: TIGR02281 family clan AA aspartic protease [Ghiorsea sp.]
MFKLSLYILCLILPLSAQAELYKIIDEDGYTTYTDIAPEMDAKEYKLGSISSVGNPLFNMNKLNMRIPYTEENGAMIIAGSVNGVNMRFVVDTGATLLAIPPEIAKRAGLLKLPSQEITAQTANGAIKVQRVTIKQVTIAKINQSNIDATIQSVSTVDANLGLLGMSFFNKYKMTIDHTKREIQLDKK